MLVREIAKRSAIKGRRYIAPCGASSPAEPGRDVLEDRLDDVGVVVDAELVRHRQQHSIGFRDRLVALELRNELIRFVGITAAENRALGCALQCDTVPPLAR